MGLADELRKLQQLRDEGTLTDVEFEQAKASLLKGPPADRPDHPSPSTRADSLGDAAKTWVTFQIIMTNIGLIAAAIFFFGFWLPRFNQMGGGRFP